MAKDVVYIDVEDDITTIVGKVKASKADIVALVPPNRVGVLQSAVNMKLLERVGQQTKKRIVLISNNQSLATLAGMAGIPVARNLQSKPELAEVPVLKIDKDDLIDGNDLSIGELSQATEVKSPADKSVEAVIESNQAANAKDKGKSKKSKTKVPNFSSFRKKFLIIGGASLALIGFLVWAIWFAPRATVVISAKTTSTTVDRNIQLTVDGETNVENGVLRAIKQEQKQDVSVEFTATGEENRGDKASGSVILSSNDNIALLVGISIPANTELTSSSGKVFVTNQSIRLTNTNYSQAVNVNAAERGESYNGATGSLTGAPSSVTARFRDATTGGTTKMVKIVTDDDIANATTALDEKKADGLQKKLESTFGSSSILVDGSYLEDRASPTPSVAVGAEASSSVALKTTVTASMLAVEGSQLTNFLQSSLEKEITGKSNQKIYDNGVKGVKFAQFSRRNDRLMVRITANGKIGPVIDQAKVKEQVRGKRYGDIQSSLESIEGVSEVDTKFWPFWVNTVPNNIDQITVEFKLQDAS